MGDHDFSVDVSKSNELGRANEGGSGSRLVADDCDPYGRITTFRYRCDPELARSRRRKRGRSSMGKKAKAATKRGASADQPRGAGTCVLS